MQRVGFERARLYGASPLRWSPAAYHIDTRDGHRLAVDKEVSKVGALTVQELDVQGFRVWELFLGMESENFQIVYPLLRFGFSQPAIPGVGPQSLPHRLKQMKATDAKIRHHAASMLTGLRLNAAEERRVLKEGFANPDITVRVYVAFFAEKAKTLKADVVPLLFEAIKHGDDYGGSGGPVHAVLTNIGPSVIPALVKMFDDPRQSSGKRQYAIAWLATHLEDPRCAAAVRRGFVEGDKKVRDVTFQDVCANWTSHKKWIPEILKFLDGKDRAVAKSAMGGLAYLGPDGEIVIPDLLRHLDQEDIRTNAFWALLELVRTNPTSLKAAKDLIPALIKYLGPKQRREDVWCAANVLTKVHGPAIGKQIAPLLLARFKEHPKKNGTEFDVYYEMIASLHRIGPCGGAESVEPLCIAIRDNQEFESTRFVAIDTLRQIGPAAKAASPTLLAALKESKQPEFTYALLRAIEAVDPATGKPRMKKWLKQREKELRGMGDKPFLPVVRP